MVLAAILQYPKVSLAIKGKVVRPFKLYRHKRAWPINIISHFLDKDLEAVNCCFCVIKPIDSSGSGRSKINPAIGTDLNIFDSLEIVSTGVYTTAYRVVSFGLGGIIH